MTQRSLHVLVVEDDEAQRHLLRRSLERRGHVVVAEVARGDDARLHSLAMDVAVVDLGLPGKSGVDVIRALLDRDPSIAVLVVTASAHGAAITEALFAGALGYVVKGARLADVMDSVELVADRKLVRPAS